MKMQRSPKTERPKSDFLDRYSLPLRAPDDLPAGVECLVGIPPISITIPGGEDEPTALRFILRVLDPRQMEMVADHLDALLSMHLVNLAPVNSWFRDAWCSDSKLRRHASTRMGDAMRRMADMWIDSGKSGDSDAPADRNIEDVLPGRCESLFHLLSRQHNQLWVELGMRRDGTIGIKDQLPRFNEENLQRDGVEALQTYAETCAAFYFRKLLDSPDSRRVARCDSCKRYFAYERARLRTTKRGGVLLSVTMPHGSLGATHKGRSRQLAQYGSPIVG